MLVQSFVADPFFRGSMPPAMQRPAAASEGPTKKPACFAEWLDKAEEEEHEQEDGAKEEEEGGGDMDTSTITPAQRHAFRKALAGLP